MLNAVTIGYNSGNLLYDSVMSFMPDEVYIALHSTHQKTRYSATRIANAIVHTTVVDWQVNRGVSKSWNDGIRFFMEKYPNDGVLLLNDDIICRNDSLDMVMRAIEDHSANPVVGAIKFYGHNDRLSQKVDHGFACVYLTNRCIRAVGDFDENFTPAYYEDIDFAYRMSLMGLREVLVDGVDIVHAGSSTIFNDPKLQSDIYSFHFVRNERYYAAKWGGKRGEEMYSTPFNR